jgi:hypothetical protein
MKTSKPLQNNRSEVQVFITMRVLIAVMLIVGCAVFLIYALWRVARDLVIIRHAPAPPLTDRDDYDLAPNANQLLPAVQKAYGSIDELNGSREQT